MTSISASIISVLIVYAALVGPMSFIRLATKGYDRLSKHLVGYLGPIFEEAVYRYILLAFLVFHQISLYGALPFLSLIYALAPNHILTSDDKGWDGYYRVYYVFLLGIVLGIIAIEFGLIAAIVFHIFYNTGYQYLTSRIFK